MKKLDELIKEFAKLELTKNTPEIISLLGRLRELTNEVKKAYLIHIGQSLSVICSTLAEAQWIAKNRNYVDIIEIEVDFSKSKRYPTLTDEQYQEFLKETQ